MTAWIGRFEPGGASAVADSGNHGRLVNGGFPVHTIAGLVAFRGRATGNFANLSPLMDLIFGTYHCPEREPAELGVADSIPAGYLAQLAHPFILSRGKAEPK